MAKVKNLGYTDTAIAGNPTLNFTRGPLNFQTDFRVKSNQPGKEVILTNITSPPDRPERIRLGFTEVANVYSGTSVDPSLFAPSKRGVQILCQLTEVISVTDSVDPTYRVYLPVSYHLVIKVPTSENIASSDVVAGIGRLLSGLYDTGVVTTTRLDSILRGALVPSGL